MTLEEIVQQLRDAQTVTAVQTLRHETRLKEHQQWLEDNELAYARHRVTMAEIDATMAAHAERLVEIDEKLTQLASAHLLSEEKWQRLEAKIDAFIDSLQRGGNGHN
jgi:hypothetical protein